MNNLYKIELSHVTLFNIVAAYYALSLLLIKFPHALAFIHMYKHFQNGDVIFLTFLKSKVYSPVWPSIQSRPVTVISQYHV